MRIHFDNVAWEAPTGPNVFASRLAEALFDAGHPVLQEAAGADLSLVFIEPSGEPLCDKVVQRLDGIWSKPDGFEAANRGIKALYDRADAVVWQSHFDRAMALRHWQWPGRQHRVPRTMAAALARDKIIANGVQRRPVARLTIPRLVEMRAQHQRIYVCSANWHPQKRLQANVELFDRLRLRHPDSCLVVMGHCPTSQMVAHPHVFYAGSMLEQACAEVYSAADWMLHLAWGDHCPNVVVEALAQGTPVACSEVGGTKELIGGYGRVLRDAPYNFQLHDYDDPPPIDVSQVDDLPARAELDYASIADIDIASVAKKYVAVFEQVLQ
jgi:glycosyltransferase involved in cell wall biosynthesis